MYETDLNNIIHDASPRDAYPYAIIRNPNEKMSVLEEAYALTASANAQVGPARRAYYSSVKEVVVRENNARVGQPTGTAHFAILRAVENFLSVATNNVSSTPHVDLLPLGHPLLPHDGTITASAYADERAEWEAGTLNAHPQTKALVASILAGDTSSVEYKFAVVRLKASAPEILSRLV